MRHGYRTAQGDFDPEDPYDEDEHPTTCFCSECVYDEWLIYQGEDRQDPLDDENYTPPF